MLILRHMFVFGLHRIFSFSGHPFKTAQGVKNRKKPSLFWVGMDVCGCGCGCGCGWVCRWVCGCGSLYMFWSSWLVKYLHKSTQKYQIMDRSTVCSTACSARQQGKCESCIPPGENGRHFTDDILRCIFTNEKFCISIKISLKFVPMGPIDKNIALV